MVSLPDVNTRFKALMQQHYGSRLHKVILYGSYARGDFHTDSDVDYLVLLNDEVRSMTENLLISKHLRQQNDDFGIPVQAFVCGKERFEKEANPLFYFIKKE